MKIYTIGHSIHSKETFIEMLQNAGVGLLADVSRKQETSAIRERKNDEIFAGRWY
jgi:uncharacterized protein (DUF488 family)